MSRALTLVIALTLAGNAWADAVVNDGRFTNVYVYPFPATKTWEEHITSLKPELRPKEWPLLTRAKIDAFVESLMEPKWPSYFSSLYQYGRINPPRFFGSYVASQRCVDAAMRDARNGVIEQTTVRSLANCHDDGMDPSPQLNLIFSPDMKVAWPTKTPVEPAQNGALCFDPKSPGVAYHDWWPNVPNFTAIPLAVGCVHLFSDVSQTMAHEIVELLSDPGQVAHGAWGGKELGDQCDAGAPWDEYTLVQYRSDNDKGCVPLAPPKGAKSVMWLLGEGSPKVRFTGSVHMLTLEVPRARALTDAPATDVQIWVQTGGDDLRGGNDNAEVTLTFAGGSTLTKNVNGGRQWGNGQTHAAKLDLPSTPLRVSDIQGITLTTKFGGGIDGDNWNVDRVALRVAFADGSVVREPEGPIKKRWLDASGGPLVRFTGTKHEHTEPVPLKDEGRAVSALEISIATGNDDLRGGDKPGDNCDVIVELTSDKAITIANVNEKGSWKGWTEHTLRVPLPAGGLKGGDVKAITLRTGFGGGVGGDNWNVQRLLLTATYGAPIARPAP